MPKVVVDHTGICEGYNFKANVPVEVSDSVVRALGSHATVISNEKQAAKQVVAPPKNKMVNAAPKSKMIKK